MMETGFRDMETTHDFGNSDVHEVEGVEVKLEGAEEKI
jgi:hypothetical protein